MCLLHGQQTNCWQEYDGSALRGVLEEMTPENARVVWMSKNFQASPMQLLIAQVGLQGAMCLQT